MLPVNCRPMCSYRIYLSIVVAYSVRYCTACCRNFAYRVKAMGTHTAVNRQMLHFTCSKRTYPVVFVKAGYNSTAVLVGIELATSKSLLVQYLTYRPIHRRASKFVCVRLRDCREAV